MSSQKNVNSTTEPSGRSFVARSANHKFKPVRFIVSDLLAVAQWSADGVEKAFDASGSDKGRLTAIQATRKWGKIALVGEGGTLTLSPSYDMIHDQKTIYGSWVTSIWLMEDLVGRIVRWKIHPEDLVTNRFPLEKADEAYALMASGKSGKVAVGFDEELK